MFACTEFKNDKILERSARQMRSIWILEFYLTYFYRKGACSLAHGFAKYNVALPERGVFLMTNDTITIKAPAKINLSLDVTGRRENGYHDLRMLMQTIDLYDELTLSLIHI